jgi:uncharacterized membrane protein YidH (DUF202 family)
MSSVDTFVSAIVDTIINPLITLLMVLGVLYFLWGLVQFIANAADSEGRETGKRHMIWGIVGLFIMVSVFGIIQVLLATFDIR